jgi:hypothetical protein
MIIIGDSFCHTQNEEWAWPNLLNADQVHSYPGASEYRLWQKAKKFIRYNDVAQINDVPLIFVHTSPYRIHTDNNPFHNDDVYSNSDIVITDALAKDAHPDIEHLKWFVKHCFNKKYLINIHKLILVELLNAFPNALHISWFDQPFPDIIKINVEITHHLPCHMNKVNNRLAYEQVKCILKSKDYI